MSQKIKPGHVLVEVVQGVEGPSLSIGDNDTGERVAGPKPWGGGRTIHCFQVAAKDLVRLAKEYASAEPSAPKCETCNGTGMVDDGEITCPEGGIPYENGPVRCVKDCPACKPTAPVDLCSTCKGYGKYQDGDSGTDEDGRCPNIVDCDCDDSERMPQYRASAPVERDDGVLIDTLRTCEKWFIKHSPTAPLIGGFGDAEHPMLTCIRAALERKP